MADQTQHVLPLVGKYAPKDGREALVDPGVWFWARHFTWFVSANGYVVTRTGGRTITLHRIVCDTPPGRDTDHINHDRLDNRSGNLRAVTRQQNIRNTGPRRTSNGKSAFKGVCRHISKTGVIGWMAQITVEGIVLYLGRFPIETDAARAYDHAVWLVFGIHGWLNFPGEQVDCLSPRALKRLHPYRP